jgi:small subunit ribosomal protein S5
MSESEKKAEKKEEKVITAQTIEQKIDLPERKLPQKRLMKDETDVVFEEKEEETKEEEIKEKEPVLRDIRKERVPEWIPKTELGQRVLKGEFKTIEDVLRTGQLILEPEIVDYLVPELKNDIVYIGGSPGKGGGIRRTATKRTVRMHKSGRRFKLSSVMIVGNEAGIVGLGKASSREHKTAIEKALEQAKLNVISIKKGCGSWECGCGSEHSIPFKTEASCGSVKVRLIPAPKGMGIVASDPVKKILSLAGIRDVWVKTSGNTHARSNLIYAVFEALRNLKKTKGDL